jgi:hypothetical protein
VRSCWREKQTPKVSPHRISVCPLGDKAETG